MTFIALIRTGHGLANDSILGKVDFMNQQIDIDHQLFLIFAIIGMTADAAVKLQNLSPEIGMVAVIALLPVAPMANHTIVPIVAAGLLMLAHPERWMRHRRPMAITTERIAVADQTVIFFGISLAAVSRAPFRRPMVFRQNPSAAMAILAKVGLVTHRTVGSLFHGHGFMPARLKLLRVRSGHQSKIRRMTDRTIIPGHQTLVAMS